MLVFAMFAAVRQFTKMPDSIRNGWDEAETKEWNNTKPNQESADAERNKFLSMVELERLKQ
jgi:hypothetical protein